MKTKLLLIILVLCFIYPAIAQKKQPTKHQQDSIEMINQLKKEIYKNLYPMSLTVDGTKKSFFTKVHLERLRNDSMIGAGMYKDSLAFAKELENAYEALQIIEQAQKQTRIPKSEQKALLELSSLKLQGYIKFIISAYRTSYQSAELAYSLSSLIETAEHLVEERDKLAQENEKLKKELEKCRGY